LLGAFALVEVIAGKVVASLGEAGIARVGELETTLEAVHGPVAAASGDGKAGGGR
jgi:hypothetical protein